jgi:hypothetical protein
MKMNRNRFYITLVVFIAGSVLIGCLVWRSWAIKNAIQACNPDYGLEPVEKPTASQAKLTRYGKAEPSIATLPVSQRFVWVVEMKGRWKLIGSPPSDPGNPGPFYSDECTIIIDARTGESLSLIRQEKAIQLAIQACNPAYGLQPVEDPTEAEAKLYIRGASIGLKPPGPVWDVTMKGRWLLVGGPQPAPDPSNPTPQPSYDSVCYILINARTGETLSPPIE